MMAFHGFVVLLHSFIHSFFELRHLLLLNTQPMDTSQHRHHAQ
jgi:hypothetical protein